MEINSKEMRQLERITEASQVEPFYMRRTEKQAKYLISRELIERNKTDFEETEEGWPCRPTQLGLDLLANSTSIEGTGEGESLPEIEESGSVSACTDVGLGFVLRSDVPVPKRRRSARAEKYPFDIMEIGQSFHVAATEECPKPDRKLASTVSSANGRYKDEEGKPLRKFVLRSVGNEDPEGEGARVFRVNV